jgi:microcin C transport system permease protein
MSFQYVLRRLLLMLPTFLGITLVSFVVIQAAPGGPIEAYIAKVKFASHGGGEGGGGASDGGGSGRTSQVSDQVVEELKKQYGFDKPMHIRYLIWLKNIALLDFGYSHTFGRPVVDVIKSKFPVSVRYGIASLIITYLVCIPLGIAKAVKDGTPFDNVSSILVFVLYSVPSFMLAILLIVFFAGGRYLDWFPMGGLESLDADKLEFWARVRDQLWHMVMPLICYVIGSFATLTVLMKNSIIEEINKDYVRTARAKGVRERVVLMRHALRNALIPLATGVGGNIGVIFTGSLLLEQIFNLDGFGKLFYDAALQRDYPVMLAEVIIGAVILQAGQFISDMTYTMIDPRMSLE